MFFPIVLSLEHTEENIYVISRQNLLNNKFTGQGSFIGNNLLNTLLDYALHTTQ